MPTGLTQHKQTGAQKQEQLDRTNPFARRHFKTKTGHRQLFAVFFKLALKSCPQRSNHHDEAPQMVTRSSA
jgi:hypothetical protein